MARLAGAAVLVGVALALGCSGTTVGDGGGDGGDSSAPPQVSPVKKCQDYATKWCTKAFKCYVSVGRLAETARQQNVDKCIDVILERLPCSAVDSIGGSYDACMSGIDAMNCRRWDVPALDFGTITPPVACDDALIISD